MASIVFSFVRHVFGALENGSGAQAHLRLMDVATRLGMD